MFLFLFSRLLIFLQRYDVLNPIASSSTGGCELSAAEYVIAVYRFKTRRDSSLLLFVFSVHHHLYRFSYLDNWCSVPLVIIMESNLLLHISVLSSL